PVRPGWPRTGQASAAAYPIPPNLNRYLVMKSFCLGPAHWPPLQVISLARAAPPAGRRITPSASRICVVFRAIAFCLLLMNSLSLHAEPEPAPRSAVVDI